MSSQAQHAEDSRAVFLWLVNNFKHLAALKGVPLEAIQWLLSESGRSVLVRLVEHVHIEWNKQLPAMAARGAHPYRTLDEGSVTAFSTWVNYEKETLRELERLYVTQCPPDPPAFPEMVHFAPIYCCKHVSRTPRIVPFDFLDIRNKRDEIGIEEVLFRMHLERVRPALPEEAWSFFKANDPKVFYRDKTSRAMKGKVPVYVLGALTLTVGDGNWDRKYLRIMPAPDTLPGVEIRFIAKEIPFSPKSSFLVVRE